MKTYIDNKENISNINLVVHLLKENGINQIVISPGGTNIPFVQAVQNDDFFTCYSIVDERSAIYFAIGLYLQSGKIVATSCTSAQATRNYIPGLTEAFYKKVPILAITMSKHPRFTYQEYMQAPDQSSLPADCVKKSFSLPYLSDENDIYHSIRVTNQAIHALTHNGYGPVQLCIPWLDFPLDDAKPLIRNIKTYTVESEWDITLHDKKIMLAIGEHREFTQKEHEAIENFCNCYNAMVYTNHLSNYHGDFSVNGNLLLSITKNERFEQEFAPDVLITIGGQTGDYPFYKKLASTKLNETEHWRVSEDGEIVDTYDKLTKVFQCTETFFFEKLFIEKKSVHTYFDLWKSQEKHIDLDVEIPFSNVSIAKYLHDKLPQKSTIQFSILNSLRVWELFSLDPTIKCFSNVGAFGIDGGLSTLIGQSMVSDELCFMIIGDLAFCYDMNSISIRHIKNNLRILLINNNGGFEFKLNGKPNPAIDNYIAAANHFKNAKGWAETCGFTYLSASTMEDFKEKSSTFLESSTAPILFEVFVSDIDESLAYNSIIYKNKDKTLGEQLKKNLKSALGQDRIAKIKESSIGKFLGSK